MERRSVSTGTKWEGIVGYSRAVRVGPFVQVTGTTAWDADGNCVGIGDAGQQTRQILKNIGRALEACGASVADVVRTRIYVTNIARDWEAVGRVHGEVFGEIRPCTTMVEVSALIAPEYLVEIEADAIVASGPSGITVDS
jgi:enamine deaminase RidA (YjgF/YER057c/UK114 family)